MAYNKPYIMASEPALQRNYGDLIMMIRPEMRHYSIFDLLIKFKYVPLNKLGELSGQDVRVRKRDDLIGLSSVKKVMTNTQVQLSTYRQTLTKKYGDTLKLRTYTVVAIGVERLL